MLAWDGIVLSVDEKTNVQARERIRPERAVQPGQPRRMEWEYKRHGIVNLLASFDVRTGKIVHHEFVEKNNSAAFIQFLKSLMELYPKGKLYLVLDNGTTHCSRVTRAFLAENERLVPVYTPTHASWLNQVEIWFGVMARHIIHHASFKSREELRARIAAYIDLHNRELAMPYEWSTKGKPLVGATAKARRRSRNTPRGSRRAFRC